MVCGCRKTSCGGSFSLILLFPIPYQCVCVCVCVCACTCACVCVCVEGWVGVCILHISLYDVSLSILSFLFSVAFYAVNISHRVFFELVYKPLSYLVQSLHVCVCTRVCVCVHVCLCCGCWRDSYGIQFLLCIPLNESLLSGGILIAH